MTIAWTLLGVGVATAVLLLVRKRPSRPARPDPVELASEDSFPASDPPQFGR